jgi:hypothetical protein
MKHSLRHHRKLVKAGPEAAWLFVCLVLWSDEQGQDGLIDAELVQSIAVAGGMKPSRVKPATERLYAVGLLDPEPPKGKREELFRKMKPIDQSSNRS